jgi:hypothetical protein
MIESISLLHIGSCYLFEAFLVFVLGWTRHALLSVGELNCELQRLGLWKTYDWMLLLDEESRLEHFVGGRVRVFSFLGFPVSGLLKVGLADGG